MEKLKVYVYPDWLYSTRTDVSKKLLTSCRSRAHAGTFANAMQHWALDELKSHLVACPPIADTYAELLNHILVPPKAPFRGRGYERIELHARSDWEVYWAGYSDWQAFQKVMGLMTELKHIEPEDKTDKKNKTKSNLVVMSPAAYIMLNRFRSDFEAFALFAS
jgi:hypothetical protein